MTSQSGSPVRVGFCACVIVGNLSQIARLEKSAVIGKTVVLPPLNFEAANRKTDH